MSKNTRFAISSIILSLLFLSVSLLEIQNKVLGIVVISIASVALLYWSIKEAIRIDATLVTLLLPPLYTLGVGLFWFLLPSTILSTLPIVVLYGVGMFGLYKTMNIFAVSTYKKIALSRAAGGVGFVLTLFTSFLLYDAILSLKTLPMITVPVIFVVSFVLLLQGLWSSELSNRIDRRVIQLSATSSYAIATMALILFFWPVSLIEGSLLLTVAMYVLLGIGQARIEGRLFKTTIREYLIIGIVVLGFMILITSWRNF